MKKTLLFVNIFFVIILFFTSCSNPADSSNYSLIHSSNHYQVFAYNDKNILSDYTYFIFNNKGDKIDSGYYKDNEPKFEEFQNGITKITINYGTNSELVKYYDLTNSRISEEYSGVYFDNGELVIYIDYIDDDTYLYAKNIFDSDLLLKEKLDMDGIMTNFLFKHIHCRFSFHNQI